MTVSHSYFKQDFPLMLHNFLPVLFGFNFCLTIFSWNFSFLLIFTFGVFWEMLDLISFFCACWFGLMFLITILPIRNYHLIHFCMCIGKTALQDHINSQIHQNKLHVASTSKLLDKFFVKKDSALHIRISLTEAVLAFHTLKHHIIDQWIAHRNFFASFLMIPKSQTKSDALVRKPKPSLITFFLRI